MCSLSEYELLTNYDLFEKSLNSILGKSGKAILTGIKKEILAYAISIDPTITIGDIHNSPKSCHHQQPSLSLKKKWKSPSANLLNLR
jgi:hypothetical protein